MNLWDRSVTISSSHGKRIQRLRGDIRDILAESDDRRLYLENVRLSPDRRKRALDLSEMRLVNVYLGYSDIYRVNFSVSYVGYCSFKGSLLEQCDLKRVSFYHSEFGTSRFEESDLSNARFTECSLDGATISKSTAYQLRIDKSRMHNGWIVGTTANRMAMECSSLRVRVDHSRAQMITVSESTIKDSEFHDCDLDHSWFSNCILYGVTFTGCGLEETRFDRCVLVNCSFKDCRMDGLEFTNSILFQVSSKPPLSGSSIRTNTIIGGNG